MKLVYLVIILLFVFILYNLTVRCKRSEPFDAGGFGVVSSLGFYNNDAVYHGTDPTIPEMSGGYVIPHHIIQ
jgi:hypothetical protein